MVTISDNFWPVAPHDKKEENMCHKFWFVNIFVKWPMRRERVFREFSNLLEIYSSVDIISHFHFESGELEEVLIPATLRSHSSSPLLRIYTALRLYATVSFLYGCNLHWIFTINCLCNFKFFQKTNIFYWSEQSWAVWQGCSIISHVI